MRLQIAEKKNWMQTEDVDTKSAVIIRELQCLHQWVPALL
jgi:hypothetical protein